MAQTCLDRHSIRLSEDCYVDKLFEAAPQCGAVFIAANFPRAYIDVNRPAFALDAAMFCDMDKPVAAALAAAPLAAAVRAGFGVVPRRVTAEKAIYKGKITFAEALTRLAGCYFPYHAALSRQLSQLRAKFGEAVLLDCHSMPGIAAYYSGRTEPDIVLGDRFGSSCGPNLTDLAQYVLEDMGYAVARNHPYAGGAITEIYGCPEYGFHALQIEINRKLYLNLHNLQVTENFFALQADMQHFARRLTELWQADYPLCAAAE